MEEQIYQTIDVSEGWASGHRYVRLPGQEWTPYNNFDIKSGAGTKKTDITDSLDFYKFVPVPDFDKALLAGGTSISRAASEGTGIPLIPPSFASLFEEKKKESSGVGFGIAAVLGIGIVALAVT